MKSTFLKLSLVAIVFMAGMIRAAFLEGAVIIVNEGVPVTSLSAAAVKDIYNGKTMYWEGGQVVVIGVMEKTDAALREVSGMDLSAFKTFWQRLAFSGRGQMPKKCDDAASLVSMVASTKGAIAIVPADAELKGVKKLEIK